MHIHFLLAFLAITMPLAGMAHGQSADEVIPRIIQSSQKTITRLQSEAVTWTTSIEILDGAARAIIENVSEPGRRKIVVTIAGQGQTEELVRIVERDNLWYVSEPDRKYKSRPYEAALALPSTYHLLNSGELRVFDSIPDPSILGEYQRTEGGNALFRTPLPPEQVAQLEALKPVLNQALSSNKGDAETIKKQLALFDELTQHGIALEINLENGYLAASGAPGKRQAMEKFQWLPTADAKSFDIGGEVWGDQTSSLAVDPATRDNLAMIGHCRAWQPGNEAYDTDTVLLNIKTGEVRRIPYQHSLCLPGCFSSDRTKVYVGGVIPVEGGGGLFEIDLLSGVNRRIAEQEIHGIPMGLTLSPDGRTLALIELAPGRHSTVDEPTDGFFKNQVLLVNVETSEVKKLGQPMDTSFLSWLPDASGLILITRKYESMDEPSKDALARMNMSGELTELRQGSRPVLVHKGMRILYQDQENKQWFTCDLSGNNPTLVGDGLSGFGFPSASPTGDQVLMMRFDQSRGPRPHVVDLANGKATPIEADDGLWTLPAWR